MQDILGHTFNVGDKVLTNAYWQPGITELTTIEKINKKTVAVTVRANKYVRTKDGKWTYVKCNKRMLKRPAQLIVVTEQLEHNRKTYPENMV